jgi:hypothetical protein
LKALLSARRFRWHSVLRKRRHGWWNRHGSGYRSRGVQRPVPTSPSRELYATGDLSIAFANPTYAFGFYATDVSDLGAALTVTFNDGASGSYQVTSVSGRPTGSLLFFGVTSDDAISSVSFKGAKVTDGFGFDDLTIGTTAAVPEPATWAMFISGFGLIGGAMRRREKRNLKLA